MRGNAPQQGRLGQSGQVGFLADVRVQHMLPTSCLCVFIQARSVTSVAAGRQGENNTCKRLDLQKISFIINDLVKHLKSQLGETKFLILHESVSLHNILSVSITCMLVSLVYTVVY